ncbi:MAG: TonB family protein [Candidatus Binatia bacterium]
MIHEPFRFPQALLFALVLHACVLLLVRIPPMAPEPSAARSLIVHLSAVAERATAPASEPQPAAASMPSSSASLAAVLPEPPIEPQPAETEIAPSQSSEADVAPVVPVEERSIPAPQPAGDVAVGNVESERIDTALLDDSMPAMPTDQAVEIAAEVRASYQDVLADWLRRHRQYPMHLRRRGVEGDGSLRLRVDRRGNVALARMESPIPDARLNELSMDLVRRSSPFPRMPDDLEGESFECVIDIRYRLGD